MTFKKIWWLCFLCLTLYTQAQKIDLKLTNKITVNRDTDYVYAYTLPEPSTFSPHPEYWYFWYSGGTIKATRGGYDGKLLNGKFSCFYHNKNLEEQGYFKKGVKVGRWVSWYPSGEMESISHWKKGKQVRRSHHYNEQHQLVRVYKYRKGEAILKYPKAIKKKKVVKDTLQKSSPKKKWFSFKRKKKFQTEKAPKVKKSKKNQNNAAPLPAPTVGEPSKTNAPKEKPKKEKKPKQEKVKDTKTKQEKPQEGTLPQPNVPSSTPIPVQKDNPKQ